MSESARESSVSALLVGEFETDRLVVHEIFRRRGWRLFEASGRHGALHCLERKPVQVVITETDVPHWDWKKLLSDLHRLVHPPQLIVTSRRPGKADECATLYPPPALLSCLKDPCRSGAGGNRPRPNHKVRIGTGSPF